MKPIPPCRLILLVQPWGDWYRPPPSHRNLYCLQSITNSCPTANWSSGKKPGFSSNIKYSVCSILFGISNKCKLWRRSTTLLHLWWFTHSSRKSANKFCKYHLHLKWTGSTFWAQLCCQLWSVPALFKWHFHESLPQLFIHRINSIFHYWCLRVCTDFTLHTTTSDQSPIWSKLIWGGRSFTCK